MAEDNYIARDMEKLDDELMTEFHEKGKLHPDFLPFPTFNLVQMGYPYPDHGGMVAQIHGGTDENGVLLPSNGMWMKVEDFKALLLATENIVHLGQLITMLNTRHRDGKSIKDVEEEIIKLFRK